MRQDHAITLRLAQCLQVCVSLEQKAKVLVEQLVGQILSQKSNIASVGSNLTNMV